MRSHPPLFTIIGTVYVCAGSPPHHHFTKARLSSGLFLIGWDPRIGAASGFPADVGIPPKARISVEFPLSALSVHCSANATFALPPLLAGVSVGEFE